MVRKVGVMVVAMVFVVSAAAFAAPTIKLAHVDPAVCHEPVHHRWRIEEPIPRRQLGE